MSYIDSVNVGGTPYKIQETSYITPSLSSTAYTAALANFTLAVGATVQAKFATTNPANATLNVNSTGAKDIFYNNAKITASQFKVNHVYTLVYDGTQWQLVGDIDTNTQTVTGVKGNSETNYRTGNVNITKANIGLGNVENQALSTWTGTNTIATVGTITSGTWQGTKIANDYIANPKVTIAGNDVPLGESLAASTLTESLGLSNAMHFIGKATVAITDGSTTDPVITGYTFGTNGASATAGDVVIDKDTHREYVWTKAGAWELLGFDTSTTYSQTTSGNTFISSVSQATDGTVTAETRALDTSGTWSGVAKGLLYTNQSITTAPGDGKLTYSYLVTKGTAGLFNATDNSNAVLNISRHSGNYVSQLGFSSDGRIYYRKFSGAALNTTTTWNKVAWMSDIEALDGNLNSTTPGVGKTLTAFSQTDGKVSATFGDISITKSQISDFTHTHNFLEPISGSVSSGENSPNNTLALGIKKYFNDHKADIPRGKLISFGVSAYGNALYAIGHFLSGYDNGPYGGFFAVHYQVPRFVGISGGSYEESKLARINVTNTTTSGQVLIADGADGKIKTSGYTIAKSVPSDAKFTDTTSFTITANATDGYWDLTGTSGTNAVTYALAPYSSKQSGANFYTGTTDPDGTTRLNYNGYLYATKYISSLSSSSWLDGQRYVKGAFNIADYSNTGGYNPWMRATNTWSSGAEDAKVGRWFSFGTLGASFYWMGSTTTRTENSYDHALRYDVSNGKLFCDGTEVSLVGHTHTLSIAEDSGTNALTLAYGKKYKLTAGGSTYIFTMPASDNTNTATAVDNILDGSNSDTAITYAPYSQQQSKLSFDTSSTPPSRTDRLNLNGYLYATKLYSGGNEVLTSHRTYTAVSGKKPIGNQTPDFGRTFDIEQVGQDATGQVSVTERTVKIPDTAASTSTAGLVNTEAQTFAGKKTFKYTTRIYPRIGATGEKSKWYKITFPYYDATTSSTAKWFMNSFDLHFGGGYSANPSGVAHVIFYWTRAANNGAWAVGQQAAFIEGTLVNKIGLYYRIAEPGILYVNNTANVYNGIWIDNLYVDDTGPTLDWSTITITSIADITESTSPKLSDYTKITTSYLYNDGGTLKTDSNFEGKYIKGTWLYTSAATAKTSTAKLATIESDNYIYYITPANALKSAVGTTTIGGDSTPIYWNGSTFTVGTALSDGAYKSILNNTSAGALGWNSGGNTNANNLRLINVNTLAYWNGQYNSTTSNLAYCNKGAFGTIVTNNFPTANTTTTYLRGDGNWVSLSDMGLSNAMHFIGLTTTNIAYDYANATESTTNPITVNSNSVTAVSGDVVLYDHEEYVWNGSKWLLLGDETEYKRKQTAFTNSTGTADNTNTSTTFIYSFSQTANGNITDIKTRKLPEASSSTKGIVLLGTDNGAATYGHTHTLSIVTDSGTTNLVSLSANTTYKLTAGGSTLLFKTPADSDTKLQIAAVTSGTTYYPIVATNSTSAATRQYDATGFAYLGTNGTTSAVGVAKITLGNATPSGAANNKQGSIGLYGSTAYLTTIISGAPTAANTVTLPTGSGTLALVGDNSHSHGNINSGGCITTAIAWEKDDYIIVGDNSASGKIGKGPTFVAAISSQTTSTKFLREDGSWATPSYIANTAYGNINTSGQISQTSNWTLASGDGLVVFDSSNSNKLERSGITFDASTESKVLSKKGTWVDMYIHPTDAGYKHIPSGGSSGQFLGYDSAGTAKWVNNPNTDTHMNVSLTTATISHNYILMTSTAPTSTAAQHTGLGATSLWVNSADKGKFELVLGNSTSTGSSGGQYGQLALYSESSAGTYLKAASGSSWKTATLPAATGMLAMIENSTAKGSNTKPIKIAATGLITECDTYAGGTAVTLNGISKAASTASLYAATSAGTTGQVLKSTGTGAPEWEDEYSIEIIRL